MDSERLVFLSTSSHGDGVRHQIEKVLEQRSKTFNAILRQTPTIGDALVLLDDGVGDLVAMSPQNWMEHKNEKIAIVGLLSRREPTWVLVSDDKPEYLVKNARIVCHHQLLQRQLLRLRQDLDLVSKDEIGLDGVEFDSREEIEQLEAMRAGGPSTVTLLNVHNTTFFRAKLEGIRLVCTKDPLSVHTSFHHHSTASHFSSDVSGFQRVELSISSIHRQNLRIISSLPSRKYSQRFGEFNRNSR